MTLIADLPSSVAASHGSLVWPAWAHSTAAWLARHGVAVRDACVLVPFAAHMPLARQAWVSEVGGWLPRIETTRTLAAALGGVAPIPAGALSGDQLVDRLTARATLAQHAWARDWARRDGLGFAQAIDRFVETAHQLLRAAAGVLPESRAAYWDQARSLLAPVGGAGARERLLAGLALEWAAQAPAPATDALLAHRPAAWVVISAQAAEPVIQALLLRAQDEGIPTLRQDATQPSPAWPLMEAEGMPPTLVEQALDFEDEAQRAAAQVRHHLEQRVAGDGPVALIAQDRGLVRRVRALLERGGVAVADETGWKLSTTRAGAALMSLLRLARAQAAFDDLLDGLKSGWAQWAVLAASSSDQPVALSTEPLTESGSDAPDAARALTDLEVLARRLGWTRAWAIDWQALQEPGDAARRVDVPAARALWDAAARFATAVRGGGRCSLLDALQRLHAALESCGALAALQADDAGAQLLQALRLTSLGAAFGDDAWGGAARATQIDFEGLIRWVDEVLEQVAYMPGAPPQAEVVITPMARAVLRPFAAIVWPGADEDHLGEPAVMPTLLGERVAQALGVPTRAVLREQQWAAFGLLMSLHRVHLLWRESDGDRPLGCSPLLERWKLARALPDWPAATDARGELALPVAPTRPPQPRLVAGGPLRLPSRLNATAYEALRSCPYRFHAEVVLGLRESDELEDGLDKRDYGTWLHEVLRRYHAGDAEVARASGFDADAEVDRLWQAAEAVTAEKGWDAAERRAAFLPYFAAFARLARVYVQWWADQRERSGAEVLRMELPVQADCDDLRALGVTLSGQLDRIDSVRPDADAATAATPGLRVWRILDYKTTAKGALQARVKEPTEDTQLAFYAAMLILQEHQTPALEAAYLSLEDRQVSLVAHPEVERSAQALIDGLVADMQRLAHGHPMPALGDGPACDYCRSRGLCRRDHWADGQEGA
jgi:ATP-dependent helicase/nuclease subunit B